MERFYDIAGIRFRVVGAKCWMDRPEGPLEPFVAAGPDWDHTLEFEVVSDLSEPQGELTFRDGSKWIFQSGATQIRYFGTTGESLQRAWMRISRSGNRSDVQLRADAVPAGITAKVILNAMEAEHHIASRGGVLFHSSFIRVGDRAILFTAPSGVGKSTQAALWERYRGAELINGDRSAVMMEEGRALVRGVPFSGSSRVSKNVTLPLKAIVHLSQAPQTTIQPLRGFRAFRCLWEGCSVNSWNREDIDACTQTVMNVLSAVPVFHLACTPDESAVIALEQVLKKER